MVGTSEFLNPTDEIKLPISPSPIRFTSSITRQYNEEDQTIELNIIGTNSNPD